MKTLNQSESINILSTNRSIELKMKLMRMVLPLPLKSAQCAIYPTFLVFLCSYRINFRAIHLYFIAAFTLFRT